MRGKLKNYVIPARNKNQNKTKNNYNPPGSWRGPISGKRQIISMRNRVIHGYDKIDNEIIWVRL